MLRSSIASISTIIVTVIYGYLATLHADSLHSMGPWVLAFRDYMGSGYMLLTVIVCNILPDYLALLKTRKLLNFLTQSKGLVVVGVLLLDAAVSWYLAFITSSAAIEIYAWRFTVSSHAVFRMQPVSFFFLTAFRPQEYDVIFIALGVLYVWFVPTFFTSIWLWLYAVGAFLIRAACRFDLGFDWFNRKFDIEKKPLQSIGLVAGAIVAAVYWAALGISRLV
jgi:hypothetical protein